MTKQDELQNILYWLADGDNSEKVEQSTFLQRQPSSFGNPTVPRVSTTNNFQREPPSFGSLFTPLTSYSTDVPRLSTPLINNNQQYHHQQHQHQHQQQQQQQQQQL